MEVIFVHYNYLLLLRVAVIYEMFQITCCEARGVIVSEYTTLLKDVERGSLGQSRGAVLSYWRKRKEDCERGGIM